jgi:hypothetical protein
VNNSSNALTAETPSTQRRRRDFQTSQGKWSSSLLLAIEVDRISEHGFGHAIAILSEIVFSLLTGPIERHGRTI